jgi:hypothetical protein
MEKPNIEQLKAKAYDLLSAREQIDMQLRQVNQMIVNLSQEKQEVVKEKDLKSK